MNKSKYSPEVIERSVRMVMEARNEYSSQWAAIESIAGKIGCTAETLRRWVRQHETDTGLRNGVTTVSVDPRHHVSDLFEVANDSFGPGLSPHLK